jgi:hypothetical protein
VATGRSCIFCHAPARPGHPVWPPGQAGGRQQERAMDGSRLCGPGIARRPRLFHPATQERPVCLPSRFRASTEARSTAFRRVW